MDISPTHESEIITGVILAGGRGSRMGGEDKGLMLYHNQPLYQHVLQRLRPQVTHIWINANRNIAVYQRSGIPVITDSMAGFPGPLAGMLTALQQVHTDWTIFTPCDTPELPDNLVAHLWHNKGTARAVWAKCSERDHPVLALLHRDLVVELEHFLMRGERKLMRFMQQSGGHSVLFNSSGEAFANINYPEDLLS